MTNSGSFSVLMSVYCKDSPDYLDSAMRSIWDDQEIKPSQIVLIKDGALSNDLDDIIYYWQNKLPNILKLIALPENKGLAFALNEGLKFCDYELVARMDADDISLPGRFKEQLYFLEQNPEVDVLGASIEEFGVAESFASVKRLPLDHESLRKLAKIRSPINHPVVMFRRDAVLTVGGYPEYRKAQDVALWSLMFMHGFKFANLDKVLLRMRLGQMFYSRRGIEQLKCELEILVFQKNIGFIGLFVFVRNAVGRSILRLSPNFLKKVMYRWVR